MSAMDTAAYTSSELQGMYSYTDTLKGIYYGPGSIETALPELLKEFNATKALIVTGKSLFEKVLLADLNKRFECTSTNFVIYTRRTS